MKIIIYLLITTVSLFAETNKLIITANSIDTEIASRTTTFKDNVKIQINKDKIYANELKTYLIKPEEIIKYVAMGDINFKIFSKEKEFQGEADKIIYYPKKNQYEIIGNIHIYEIKKKELLKEKILIDKKKGLVEKNSLFYTR